MDNNQLLNEIHLANNHAHATRKSYQMSVNIYCSFFDMNLHDLLQEAEEEESKGVKWKLSSLKRRLIEFRHYLLENYAYNSYVTIFNCIINIYRYYDIEIYKLPKLNHKAIKKFRPLNFKDLPDKAVIREAINICSPLMKALILFMCSSGCAIQEATNLTINDYLKSIDDYTNKRDIFEAIDDIKGRDDIVPTWNIWRQKTNKYYITYSSPESVTALNSYLISRNDPIDGNSRLFKYHKQYMHKRFIEINNELGLGTVGDNGYNRFRSHMLRKFHASALYNDGMSLDNVNDLQGKSKNKTDAAYFMINPEDLKYEYIKHLPAITINKEVEKISVKSPEFMQMENENQELKSELNNLKSEVSSLNNVHSQIDELRAFKDKMLELMSSAQYEE